MDKINLQKLNLTDKPTFDKYFRARYCEHSGYTFTNFFMWRKMRNYLWAEEDDVLYIFSSDEKTLAACQPICQQEKMHDAITKILRFAQENRGERQFKFTIVEKIFADELKTYPHAKFDITEAQNHFDYVYLVQDLINLSGRKFHGKKNHLNAFKKENPHARYIPMTENVIPMCREALNHWYETHKRENQDNRFIFYEQAAINEIFDNFSDFKLKGGVILIKNKVAAFTFGEKLNSDTAVIHVEKADANIRGIYVAINQNFVANAWTMMTYINREEDMGIEGLRKAKKSYRPIKLIEKYDATLA